VYIQRGACGVDDWLAVQDSSGADVGTSAGICPFYCGGERMACPALACVGPIAQELKPNDKQTYTWDGIVLTTDQHQGCLNESAAKGEYTVTFCWGTAPGANNLGDIQNKTCKSTTVIADPGASAQVSTAN
jgi:hypothetical protein